MDPDFLISGIHFSRMFVKDEGDTTEKEKYIFQKLKKKIVKSHRLPLYLAVFTSIWRIFRVKIVIKNNVLITWKTEQKYVGVGIH